MTVLFPAGSSADVTARLLADGMSQHLGQRVLVVNRPQGLRDMNEKVFTAWFPQFCAPTLITRDMADMHAFLREHTRIVCKPLYGMGGRSIFVVDRGDKNANVVFETMTEYGTRFAIVQRYIPDIVATGDSRILVIDGEPAPYALARIPQETDHRGNLAAGATGQGRELNERDRWPNVERRRSQYIPAGEPDVPAPRGGAWKSNAVVGKAAEVYQKNPKLVAGLGVVAAALVLQQLTRKR